MSDRPARVFTATVMAIVSTNTKKGIVEAMAQLAPAGVRPVIIELGDNPEPERCDEQGCAVIDGLIPKYLNNAVASLRLSSLPTLAWWRAEDPQILQGLAALVDHVVLDASDPSQTWALVPRIAEIAPVSDLRWTQLTRWREVIAQFFDIPGVNAAANAFDRLEIRGDGPQARLAAGWLRSRLPSGDRLHVRIDGGGERAIESLQLSGGGAMLGVRVLPEQNCLETSIRIGDAPVSTRVVAIGDQRPHALIAEELRVRSRDHAFEAAVVAAEQL